MERRAKVVNQAPWSGAHLDQNWPSAATAAADARDSQTVMAGGVRATAPKIAGVQVVERGSVLTRSGSLLELFRQDGPSTCHRRSADQLGAARRQRCDRLASPC